MKELKTNTLNRYTLFATATACLSGFLFGYYMAIISGALPFISGTFHFSLNQESAFVSMILLGAVLGSFVGGSLTHRLGRKKVFWITCLFLLFGSLLLVTTTSFLTLLIARALQGIAIGIISVVAPLYLGEIAPVAHRGAIISTYQLTMNLGILIAYIVNASLLKSENWHLMFLIGLIPLILQVFFLFFIPESPLWLFRKKKKNLSLSTLKKLDLPASFETPVQKQKNMNQKTLSFILWVGITLSAFQQVTGVNTIIYYAPRIFHEAGFDSPFAAMIATISLGAANFIACYVSVWLLDRLGRKKLLLIGIFGMMISLLCLSILSFYQIPFIDKCSVGLLIAYLFFFSMGLGPVTWVLLSEIYPPQIRDKAMSFALLTNWICVFFVLWTFPYLLSWIKVEGTFGIYACMNLIALLFVRKFIPETKKKSLEEIYGLFEKK